MKTLLRSHDLWELIETCINLRVTDQTKLKEARKRDARAMAIIQQAVHDQLFSIIAQVEIAKEAWTILKVEYHGDAHVMAVKLQGLRRDLENLHMNEGEQVGDYFSRVMNIVSQKRAYGEKVDNNIIVEKVLRSLTDKFDHIVSSIEVSKDLATLTIKQLMRSLQSFEARIQSRKIEKEGEKAFWVKEGGSDDKEKVLPAKHEDEFFGFRGRGRGSFKGRGRGGRGRGRSMGNMQCYSCQRYGHISRDCWYGNEQNQANVVVEDAKETEEDCRLFMAFIEPPYRSKH